ncbi:MAG TPA: glycosyltransferase [Stellaceae bacterium]|jgi:glycosyltransferase involved in cell wall biosynthesis|nr:glycosyltransferase [Stellaceae bacterium]
MLTLITATLNAGRFIAEAFASVPQTPEAIQHIVVDGGSTDATLAICREHPGIDTVVVPGCSIYEAWNIGLDRSRGDWIMFLNADDELGNGAADIVAGAFAIRPEAEIVAGRALMAARGGPAPCLLVAAPTGRLDVRQLALGVPAINAMAFRRSLFARCGPFETAYRVTGDREFLLRLALSEKPPVVATVDAVLYRYYVHPGSLTLQRGLEQRLRIARDHIALARRLLAQRPGGAAGQVLRYWRRREAAVAALRCAAAGRVAAACGFAAELLRSAMPER